jgi:uncharacterized membrane protein
MAFLLLALACADGGGDSASPSDSGPTGECADAPVVTWDNFGAGFLTENCDACHSATVTGDARNGAPEKVTFDTKEQAWSWAEDILRMASGDDPQMPPEGGTSADDRARLTWWLECGEKGR